MFKNTFQSGFLSILYSIGSKPLLIWDKKVRNGHIKRITDNDIQSLVLEIEGTNVSTTYITCPAGISVTSWNESFNSFRSKENAGNQASISRHDHQKLEKVLHIRSPGNIQEIEEL